MLTILLQYLKNKTTRADKQVVVLGDVQVPEGFMHLLEKGPKFGVPTSLPTHELIGINRDLSSRATQENSERCLLEGVECLQNCLPLRTLAWKDRQLDDIVSFFKSNDLSLLQADKEGGFVVMSKGVFQEKALAAVKNFVPIKKSAVRVKTEFAEFCKSLDLSKLADDIK